MEVLVETVAKLREIRRVDHQHVAVPRTSRIADPRSKYRSEVRAVVQWNDSRLVQVFLADHDVGSRLDVLDETLVLAREQWRTCVSQAAFGRRERLGACTLPPHLRA